MRKIANSKRVTPTIIRVVAPQQLAAVAAGKPLPPPRMHVGM